MRETAFFTCGFKIEFLKTSQMLRGVDNEIPISKYGHGLKVEDEENA